MKLNLFSKKTKTAKASKSGGSSMHDFGRDPFFDWSWISGIFFLLMVLCLTVALYSYFGVNKRLNAPSISGANIPKIFDQKKLENVIEDFDQHAKNFDAALHGYSGLGDPSL